MEEGMTEAEKEELAAIKKQPPLRAGYSPEGMAIFQLGAKDKLPQGYVDSPSKVPGYGKTLDFDAEGNPVDLKKKKRDAHGNFVDRTKEELEAG